MFVFRKTDRIKRFIEGGKSLGYIAHDRLMTIYRFKRGCLVINDDTPCYSCSQEPSFQGVIWKCRGGWACDDCHIRMEE